MSAGPGLRHTVITVCGELDIDAAANLRQALAAAVAVYEERVLDLAGVDFCDCAGIGTLIAARNLARRRGHRLRMRRIPGHLQRLLHLTHTRLTDTDPPRTAPAYAPGNAPARTVARRSPLVSVAPGTDCARTPPPRARSGRREHTGVGLYRSGPVAGVAGGMSSERGSGCGRAWVTC